MQRDDIELVHRPVRVTARDPLARPNAHAEIEMSAPHWLEHSMHRTQRRPSRVRMEASRKDRSRLMHNSGSTRGPPRRPLDLVGLLMEGIP